MILYAIADQDGGAFEWFARREDAERLLAEIGQDEPELVSRFQVVEIELEMNPN